MKDDITIDGTNAALSQQEEDTSTDTKLYCTQDAAALAGIQSPQLRNARKRFMQLAKRLNLSPADERRRDCGGGSPIKFWTFEQVQAIKAEHELTKAKRTITLADRVNNIRKLTGNTTKNIIEIGRELIAAKSEVGHGNWANWLKENFDWTQQTANKLMRIAEQFGDNPEFANFKPSTLQTMLKLPEEEIIDIQAEIGKTDKDQLEQKIKAAVKQKKRKKNPAPVTKPAADSEPVNHISTNDSEDKLKIDFQFEGDKPRNDAILQGYNTPCQDTAAQPQIDSEPVIEPVDDDSNGDYAPLTDAEYEANHRQYIADMKNIFEDSTKTFLSCVVDVEILYHARDFFNALVDERIAELEQAQKK